jgi:hypothetical protein
VRSGSLGRPSKRPEPWPGSASLSRGPPCRLDDENSRAKVQNVRADSSAVYEGTFDDPKTDASVRPIPLSDTALQLLRDWRGQAQRTGPDDLMFATGSGKPISPNNVLRTWIWPACQAVGLQRATWLTFRRTYSYWAHEKGNNILDREDMTGLPLSECRGVRQDLASACPEDDRCRASPGTNHSNLILCGDQAGHFSRCVALPSVVP